MAGPDESRRKLPDLAVGGHQLTWSKRLLYNKDVCFFCDGAADYRHTLHMVSTFSAGESLLAALGMSGNDKLSVNNVTNVLCKPVSANESSCRLASGIAARTELLTMTEKTLREGKIATMSEL